MIADAFLRLRQQAAFSRPDFSLVGQGYQGKDFISQASVGEKTVNESGNTSSSSL